MPQPQTKTKTDNQPFTLNELILMRLDDLKSDLQKLDTRIDKLDNRVDSIEKELRGIARHTQIMTISVVGIALTVIVFVFTNITK